MAQSVGGILTIVGRRGYHARAVVAKMDQSCRNGAVDALHQLQILAQMAPVGSLSPAVVAAMIARAVDVVVYQEHFEDEGVRRVSEIVEVDHPGVSIGVDGIEYKVRRLVAWDSESGEWVLPTPSLHAADAALAPTGAAHFV
jgi:hypothetical protein